MSDRPNILICDIEADGLLDTATRVWCIVALDPSTNRRYDYGPDDIEQALSFLRRAKTLVLHNGIDYDLPLLAKLYGFEFRGRVIDTLLLSRLQNPARKVPRGCTSGPHSVEAWGIRLNRSKPSHEDWTQYSPEMLHRCAEDVEITARILDALVEEAKGKDWKQAYRLVEKLFTILHKQEEYGWLIDQQYAELCRQQLQTWMRRIDAALLPYLPLLTVPPGKVKGERSYYKKPFLKNGKPQTYVAEWLGDTEGLAGPFSKVEFRKVRLGSNAEVKDYLLSEGWIPQAWNVNDDGERTSPKLSSTDPFEGVSGKVGRLCAKWIQCRHRDSQIKGWQENVRPDGRVAQRITGIAATGRLTHSGIVNVPGNDAFFGKRMRRIFIAKQGYKIVGVDADACQNRALAARVNNPAFTKTLLDGTKEDRTSIHYVNQAAITHYAGVTPSYKVCKNLNYAFLFGASDNKLASTANLTTDYGPKIREALLSVAPGLEKVIAELEAEWKRTAKKRPGKWGVEYYGGYVTGLDGRPVQIESPHCLLVYMLQSDEAILMQYALVLLYDKLTDMGWVHGREYGFVANVHDEIQAEVREDLAEQFAALAEASIAEAGELLGSKCPHVGQADIGINWYETH